VRGEADVAVGLIAKTVADDRGFLQGRRDKLRFI